MKRTTIRETKSNATSNDHLSSGVYGCSYCYHYCSSKPALPNLTQRSQTRPSSAQSSPIQPSPTQPSTALPSPAQSNPAQFNSIQFSSTQPSPAQSSSAQPSPIQPSPAQPNSIQPNLIEHHPNNYHFKIYNISFVVGIRIDNWRVSAMPKQHFMQLQLAMLCMALLISVLMIEQKPTVDQRNRLTN